MVRNQKILLADNSTEVLPGLSKESMNDDLEIDSSSSSNTPVEQQESYSNENSTREIEEISRDYASKSKRKKRRNKVEKKSRFGWFKKKEIAI